MPEKIVAMWAFVIVEDSGDEGVPAVHTPDGWIMPLMGGDLERMRSLRPMAQDMATALGRPVELCVFRGREVVETLQPGTPSKNPLVVESPPES